MTRASEARVRSSASDVAQARPRERGPVDPRAVLTSIGEVVYDWDLVTDSVSWGANGAEVLGLAEIGALATGKGYALAIEPGSGPTRGDIVVQSGERDMGSGIAYRTRYALRLPKGRLVMVQDTGRWYADVEGRPAFAHGVVRVEPPQGEADLAPGARERAGFISQIASEVADAARSKRSVTIIVAAIERLDRINDEFGQDDADAVIDEVSRRIRSVMRRRDRFSRYNGNRFAMALLSCPGSQAGIAAARLAAVVEGTPFQTSCGPLQVNIRIGGASAPEHASDAACLLRRAEDALAAAKRSEKAEFTFYDPAAMRPSAGPTRGTPALDIVCALNERRVTYALQPVVDSRTRVPAFREVLARIRGEGGVLVAAGDILPVVERSGLVPLLDARMLELAADHLMRHPAERLSINASPLTLESPDWLNLLAAHLGARPGIASRLIVEITETAAVRDPSATRARLDAVKALGVGIAIDDFGAGHTSFKHLRSFPIDLLKIDGAFVQNLARSTDDRFFVRTLIELAQHLGIATVAEWVEDEETAQLLASWGVDYLQGEHCGAPCLPDFEKGVTRVA